MARLSIDDKLKLWSARITAGKKWRDEQTAKRWDTFGKFALGEQWDESDPAYNNVSHHAVINITWHIFRTYLPALYYADPYLLVRAIPEPQEPLDTIEKKEKGLEALFNARWKDTRVKLEFRDALADIIMYGYDVIKTGWFDVPQDTYDAMSNGDKLPNQTAFIKRVSPRMIVVDPVAAKFSSVRWVAEHFYRPYLDVIGDSRLPRSLRDKLKPTVYMNDLVENLGFGSSRPELNGGLDDTAAYDGYIGFWEVTTFEDQGRLLTFIESDSIESSGVRRAETAGENPVNLEHLWRDEPRPFREYLRGFHYFFCSFNTVNDHLYGPSDIEMVMNQQRDLNLYASMQMDHTRMQKTVHFYNQDKIGQEAAKRLADAPDNAMIPVSGGLYDAFTSVQPPALNPDIYKAQIDNRNQIWEIAGLDYASQNLGGGSGETATLTQHRGQQGSLRLQDRANLWTDHIEEVATAFAAILLNESPPGVIQILATDVSGEREIVQVDPANFKNQFTVRLETQNTFPESRQLEISQFLQAVNLMANNPNLDLRQLAIRTFELFKVRHLDKLVPAAMIPPPIIEFMQKNPQFIQAVIGLMILAMQAPDSPLFGQLQALLQQASAPSAGGAAPGMSAAGPEPRRTADPNALQKNEPDLTNAGTASATQGGGGF